MKNITNLRRKTMQVNKYLIITMGLVIALTISIIFNNLILSFSFSILFWLWYRNLDDVDESDKL